MDDKDYRMKIELGARGEEGSGALVRCLVIAAMVSALVLVLGLACASFMAVV